MSRRQAFEIVSREDPLHLAAHRFIEAVTLLAERIIDQQKTAVGQKAAQGFHFFLTERIEFVFARQVEKRIVEQVAIRQGDFVLVRSGVDAGPRRQLFDQRGHRQRMRIPVAAAILDLREDKLEPAFFLLLGGVDDRGQQSRAEESLGKDSDELAAIHVISLKAYCSSTKHFSLQPSQGLKPLSQPTFD